MPKFWADFLETAIKEGKIPDIPQTTLVNGIPTYPDGVNPISPEVCSGTLECRIEGDHWDAPDGEIAIGFDDGPTTVSGIFRLSMAKGDCLDLTFAYSYNFTLLAGFG
jgi:chitin deacetylase